MAVLALAFWLVLAGVGVIAFVVFLDKKVELSGGHVPELLICSSKLNGGRIPGSPE